MDFICKCTREFPVIEREIQTQSGTKKIVSKGFVFNFGTGSFYGEMEGEKCKQNCSLKTDSLYAVSLSMNAISYNKGDGDSFFNKLLITKIAEL